MNLRESRTPWGFVIGAWMLPTVADVADTYLSRVASGPPTSIWRVIGLISPCWLFWVPVTPVIFWFGRRIRIQRPVRGRAIAAHVALSVLVGLAHAMVLTAAVQLFDNRTLLSTSARYVMSVQDWLPISILFYWMTLVAGYAVEGQRRERAQALRTTELEAQLARSELAVLRAQLHPHFLFNALNTGVSLVRADRPEEGVRVLTHLGDLLRQLVHGVEQEVPLREELGILESYLEIERARFGARLTIEVDVPPSLEDALVPSLVLQPLVENALRHGVGVRDAPGTVRIDARARDGTLQLRVRDDGAGLASAPASGATPGVGIANTRARLARLYGDAGSLSLRAGAERGAEAVVTLPLRVP